MKSLPSMTTKFSRAESIMRTSGTDIRNLTITTSEMSTIR